jgi:hypothetical protein
MNLLALKADWAPSDERAATGERCQAAGSPWEVLRMKGTDMNVNELVPLLEFNSDFSIRFVLPSGEFIPDHFHVTEIGRVERNFIDCGGTRRQSVACMLQTWTANDIDHRLTAGKLAKIFSLAAPVLKAPDLPVEVEYGTDVVGQYNLDSVESKPGALHFVLTAKQTDCLARDKCGVNECSSHGCCS